MSPPAGSLSPTRSVTAAFVAASSLAGAGTFLNLNSLVAALPVLRSTVTRTWACAEAEMTMSAAIARLAFANRALQNRERTGVPKRAARVGWRMRPDPGTRLRVYESFCANNRGGQVESRIQSLP